MDLSKLKDTMPYKWRVQSFSKFKPQGQCVAYVDARDVQNRLDDVCGQANWQTIYYEVGSMLFCKIGIKIGSEWVWKSDTGSESNIEKEKGHSSDAFKRAAVLWGIGRFLYDMKIQYVDANEKKTSSNYPYVVDKNGKRIWDLTKHINNGQKSVPEPKKDPFLEKMKGYAINEKESYWKVLGQFGVEKATQIKSEDQETILMALDEEVKSNAHL